MHGNGLKNLSGYLLSAAAMHDCDFALQRGKKVFHEGEAVLSQYEEWLHVLVLKLLRLHGKRLSRQKNTVQRRTVDVPDFRMLNAAISVGRDAIFKLEQSAFKELQLCGAGASGIQESKRGQGIRQVKICVGLGEAYPLPTKINLNY